MILAALAVSTSGCSGSAVEGAPPTAHPQASDKPAVKRAGAAVKQAGTKDAEIYVRVLRRYLSSPGENSFPQVFKTVYVLNQAYPDAADPNGKHERGVPIAPQTQHQVLAALAGMTHVIFVANRGSVIEVNSAGCEQVKNGGILITLGVPAIHGRELRFPINGYVACLGATWLTYVLRDQPGAGWQVTGTTATMVIS
jgi:hypothetical protein